MEIDDIISDKNLARLIFANLCDKDFNGCSLVNKTWYHAVEDARSYRTLELFADRLERLPKKARKQREVLEKNIKSDATHAREVVVYGYSSGVYTPNQVYDSLFCPQIPIRRLILRGRGGWNTCHCPKQDSTFGEQYDTIESDDLTNLEYIHITTKFEISSCALLDLISRSPKLKVLKFFGKIALHDHTEKFSSKRFYCDLDTFWWPIPCKEHASTLTQIVKRNENISTFYSNFETTCDLLSSECLPSLHFLSLLMNEKWSYKPGKYKRAYKHLHKTQYLVQAKNVEVLEIRSLLPDIDCGDEATNADVERIYEEYLLSFWKHVAKMPKLKYLAVYGAWDLDKVCREMAKHGMQVEYLKINLTPSSVVSAIEEGVDGPFLSMVDSIKNLRKLPKLRSLHYICCELLGSIDNKTALAFKELIDLIWVLDVKTRFTDDVEDLLTNIMKRGYQQGRLYEITMRIEPKNQDNASIFTKRPLKFPSSSVLKNKLLSIADIESTERYGRSSFDSIQIWSVRNIASTRDESTFRKLKSSWDFYNDKFHWDLRFV